MVDFRSLELFYWATQLSSFSKAAERMNTTQPAVSQRITALEAEFGARLFDRSARSIVLTQKGQILFEFAERFLRLRTEMIEQMAAPSAMKGSLRLGVSETIARLWLSRFIERAHAIYPNVVIDLTIDVSPTMRDLMLKGELDLAFLLGPVGEPQIANHLLCTLPLEFIASPALEFSCGEPLSIEAIRQFPIITYPKTTSPYPLLRELLSNPHAPPPRIFGNSSLAMIIQMTLDRIGLAVMPAAVAEKEIATGRLRIVRTALSLPPYVFTACYPMALAGGLAAPLAELAQQIAQQSVQPQGA